MTENGFTDCLKAVLVDGLDVNEVFDPDGIRRVETFREAEILTMNHGLVITMDDGTEFQVTIVLSRRGRSTRDDEDEE